MATRQTFLTRVRQMSDTLDNTVEYPDELLKDLAGMVHVDEWRKLLGASPYLRTQRLNIVILADNRFAWSTLSSVGTGNTKRTVHRVLQMQDAAGNNVQYVQPDRLHLVGDTGSVQSSDALWTRVGDDVQLFGCTSPVSVLINWTPCSIAGLASDSDQIDFPDEYLPVLYYDTAALALSKGGRETAEARELMQTADLFRQRMLAAYQRMSSEPWVLPAADAPWEWGG